VWAQYEVMFMNFAAPAHLITLVQTQHQKENKFVNVKN